MPTPVITAKPSPWRRHARTSGRITLAAAVVAAHLLLAAIVLAFRIAHVIASLAATGAAYAELYLASKTNRPALGQAAGVAITAAFAQEFRTAYQANGH